MTGKRNIMKANLNKNPQLYRAAVAAVLALSAAVILLAARLGGAGGRDISREAAASIREAIERTALQCYAVEGVYPPDLEYLTDQYGLAVNTRDFYVHYDAFASNLPPDVRVEAK